MSYQVTDKINKFLSKKIMFVMWIYFSQFAKLAQCERRTFTNCKEHCKEHRNCYGYSMISLDMGHTSFC